MNSEQKLMIIPSASVEASPMLAVVSLRSRSKYFLVFRHTKRLRNHFCQQEI